MVERQRIFLGHASEDKPRVRELYDQLTSRGFSPWLDAVDLMPGQNWRIEIPNAIKSAGVFLACLSQQSVAKQSYVQREFRYALSAYADRPPGSIFLIPVRLDDCAVPDLRLPELELDLRDLHWVDLFEPNGFERLVQSISVGLGRSLPKPVELDGPSEDPTEAAFLNGLRRKYIEASRADDLAKLKHELEAFSSDSGGSAEFRSFREQLEQAYERQRRIEAEALREAASPTHRTSSHVGRSVDPTISAAGIGAAAVIVAGIITLAWLPGFLKPSDESESPQPTSARQPFDVFRDCEREPCPEMVMLPAGSFTMGSPESEEGRFDREGPQHQVTISKPFAIGKTEVTFEEYDRFAEATGRQKPKDRDWGRGRRPMLIAPGWARAIGYRPRLNGSMPPAPARPRPSALATKSHKSRRTLATLLGRRSRSAVTPLIHGA